MNAQRPMKTFFWFLVLLRIAIMQVSAAHALVHYKTQHSHRLVSFAYLKRKLILESVFEVTFRNNNNNIINGGAESGSLNNIVVNWFGKGH